MSEIIRFREILLELRKAYNLKQEDIEELAHLTTNKYSRIENGSQVPTLEDIVNIGKVYGLGSHEILKPDLTIPSFDKLPTATQKVALQNKSIVVREKKSWNINDNILAVLNGYEQNENFTNSEIIARLPKELAEHMKNRSIEWNRGILKGVVEKTGRKRKGIIMINKRPVVSTKTEVEYRLVRKA